MRCVDCRYYRMKSAVGEGPSQEWGICDSLQVQEQVRVFGFAFLRRLQVPDEILREIDYRVRGDFGCIHFEERRAI